MLENQKKCRRRGQTTFVLVNAGLQLDGIWRLLRSQITALWGALTETGVILPATFLFVWQVRHPYRSPLSVCSLSFTAHMVLTMVMWTVDMGSTCGHDAMACGHEQHLWT